ncbi:DMT family transporter [Candidatus Hodarchaeum mangrovi]
MFNQLYREKSKVSIFVAIFFVSWASIFIRFAQSPPVVTAFWRLFLSVLFLVPLLLIKNVRLHFSAILQLKYMKFFFISGFFLALHFFTWFQSLEYTTVAISVLVVNTSPVWVIILSFLLFKEKINKIQILGVLFTFIGMILISWTYFSGEFSSNLIVGVVLALIGANMVAAYFIIGRRMRANYTVPNIPYVFFVNFYSSIFLLIFSLILGNNIIDFPIIDLVWFILLALGPSLLGHAMFTYAMKQLSARTVSLAVIGETIGASFLSWIILGESLSPIIGIAGSFILSGIALNVIYESEG